MDTNRNSPILSTRNVSKAFGGLMAVHNMSLEVAPRTITGLIGPNAAGKTTLMKQHLLATIGVTNSRRQAEKSQTSTISPRKVIRNLLVLTFSVV